ncbi:sugar phosphate isomerase (plasmid) [Rhizobium leguminosarum bv. trifolii CB782]|uniref:Sugar phosphate isomerase n=2 Tax=Rhizobium TaxID=379 RepID=A0ABX4JL87_9HYPH|nr:TIM barrel protein [Rhizobium hidalgonense]AHG49808.1 sugar phosphate isomerase [Rhizobium leguminosarum bv. trifolii CB782]MDR9806980.1 TIM barrel protein [Rhizobium hidalgonense]MDR9814224.1 TIM barrel protein [Rhizobium hidalgonense]PDT20797.1 sugar phosphate isomerase [Rhizobium hidalgonense]PON07030.1 sugar phosphate isomerase [Rhizobium hidalgonense]
MQILQNGRFAVSTWSLHRLLGPVYGYSPDPDKSAAPKEPYGPGAAELIDMPAALAARGIHRLEVCSFHLPSLDAAYLSELHDAMTASDVLFQTLLVEDGDPSHPETAGRDVRWMAEWIDIAAALGAQKMRVIAGKEKPTEENLSRSAGHLGWLAERAEGSGVRVVVENWFDLLPSPVEMNWLLDRLDGKVGLNGDLGNWAAPAKYEGLADIMRRAEICHAKADYGVAGLDADDYRKCLEMCERAGYAGPFTLIYDSPFFSDEWDGILLQKAFIEDFLREAPARRTA